MKTERQKAYFRAYMANRRLDSNFRETQRIYYREWYKQNGRNRSADYSEAICEWRQEHPDRVKAISILNHAFRAGKVSRPSSCVSCGRITRLSGHHIDYNKPLEVEWLCSSCHKLRHGI